MSTTGSPSSPFDPADCDFGVNQALVEEQFLRWLDNPHAVDSAWQRFFAARHAGHHGHNTITLTAVQPPTAHTATTPPQPAARDEAAAIAGFVPVLPPTAEVVPLPGAGPTSAVAGERTADLELQGRVSALVNAYRVRGHLFANLDPLGLSHKPPAELLLERFGLDKVDPGRIFSTGDMAGPRTLPLADILQRLEATYCRSIGVEFTFIEDPKERLWLQERMERDCNRLALAREDKLRILDKLTDAENFEQFLHTNYMGAKRFSLEGAESFICLTDLCVERSAALGVEEIVIGMAHRGRLNVLANLLEMNLRQIFAAFEDEDPEPYMGRGDVKYHLGFSSDRQTRCGNPVHLTLSFNPSHLEFVNAVVEGRVRAKQDRRGDQARSRVLPLLVHGDAAFSGQGVVAETLNLSQLEGYQVGGTLHVVINNQVGFTTSPQDSRSSRYCTDITRMLRCPVFHVNGEDPEAVAQVVHLATEYRQRFRRDVVVDLYCYRKHGHNETDEPRFTQPLAYAAVDTKRTVRQIYAAQLVQEGVLQTSDIERIRVERRASLERALHDTRNGHYHMLPDSMAGVWAPYQGGDDSAVATVPTAVEQSTVETLARQTTSLPDTFQVNRKVARLLQKRRERVLGNEGLDWGSAESLALASLLHEGTRIRITGQDSRRGTFSHRHAVLVDAESGMRHIPLNAVAQQGASLEIYDSPLSEAGVLGFEYGYSLDSPDALVIWEAQFGDFANGAQVIIDQFISSSEDKWHRLSGVVLLLPHSFEGQGPEHSSARLERFLNLCAEDNMQVCNLTTPAQYFHCLRRQVKRPWRKPLVVMTPKSLLRHPEAVSPVSELTEGAFARVLPDPAPIDPDKVRRILLCSGKVYYDLAAHRRQHAIDDIAIVRIEQLYPLTEADLSTVLAPYPKSCERVWVQEEPWNMGAWFYIKAHFGDLWHGSGPLTCISREASASPATGSLEAHKVEQRHLLDNAFAPANTVVAPLNAAQARAV
ncbi:MAG: 2-oxoglutarate dehydrogenase E1 component [Polyangiales bacterium]